MTEKLKKATGQVRDHVTRARAAIDSFDINPVSDGVLPDPPIRAAALKVAAEELRKAIALIERTKWRK